MMFPVRFIDQNKKKWYFVWGTVADEPASKPMKLSAFKKHYSLEFGRAGLNTLKSWYDELDNTPYHFGLYGMCENYDEALRKLFNTYEIRHGKPFNVHEWIHSFKLDQAEKDKPAEVDPLDFVAAKVRWPRKGSQKPNALMSQGSVIAYIPKGLNLKDALPPEALDINGNPAINLVVAQLSNNLHDRFLVKVFHAQSGLFRYYAPNVKWVQKV